MFVKPELSKGDVDVRIKAPKGLVESLDLISLALGLTRQDVVLVALDAYVSEASHVASVLAKGMAYQRKHNGIKTDERQ